MLTGAHNAAQAHHLNNRTRSKLVKQTAKFKEQISFLTGHAS